MDHLHKFSPLQNCTHPEPSAQFQNQPEVAQPAMNYAIALPHTPSQQKIDYEVPFGPVPVPVRCPTCQQQTISKIKFVTGGITL